MKRFFFSLIALSAAAIGCTQSALLETPEQFGTEITFSPYTGRTPVTKATSIVGATGTPVDDEGNAIGVSLANAGGFQILSFLTNSQGVTSSTPFMDGQVKYNSTWLYGEIGANNQWQATTKYWPDSGSESTLSFVGYSSNAVLGVDKTAGTDDDPEFAITTTNGLASGFTFSVPQSIDEQVDLLATAYQDGLKLGHSAVDNSGLVELQFHHLLSRVGFKLQTTTNKEITIIDLSLSGKIQESGRLLFSENPKFEFDDIDKSENVQYSYLAENTNPMDASAEAKRIPRESSEYLMIMPQTVDAAGDITINVKYQIGTYSPKTKSVKLPAGFEFADGRAYEFILKLSTSAISFFVDETPWDETNNTAEKPLIPDTQEALSAIVKVNPSTAEDNADVAFILTPTTNDLGTIGIAYKTTTESNWHMEPYSGNAYSANTPVTINVSGLSPNTQYEYKPYSIKTSNATPSYYTGGTFKTKLYVGLTVVNINGDEIEIKPYEATVSANYNTSEEIHEKGFCLTSGDSTPTIDDIKAVVDGDDFTHTFTGLNPASQYTCRAYLKVKVDNNTYEYSYSSSLSFWTAPEIIVSPGDDGNDDSIDDGTNSDEEKPDGPPAAEWEDGDSTDI